MNVQETLKAKLDPSRFNGMSAKMAALVGAVLGEEFTSPCIAELNITSDNCVLARHDGDNGANEFIGSYAEFEGNFRRLVDVARLSEDEMAEFKRLYTKNVGRSFS